MFGGVVISYVMGVDGGGSQTRVAIADLSGRFIAYGQSGGANHQIIGMEKAAAHIAEAQNAALTAAGLKSENIRFVQYGLAGADRGRDFDILRRGLSALPFSQWDVVSDAWEGLRAGTDDYVGVSVVCGSGTNVVGRNRDGKQVQVGGFDYLFGDTAGGSHLAREAFRAAVRDYQGRGDHTTLSQLVPRHIGLPDMDAVYNSFLDHDTPIPNDLALVTHEAALAGDLVCQRLLRDMGRELGVSANAALDQLGGLHEGETMPLVLVGSIVQKGRSPYLMEPLTVIIKERYPGVLLRSLDVYPVLGSILLALDHLGVAANPDARHSYHIQEV